MAAKEAAKKVHRQEPTPTVRDEVLREAGYKCANPACRNILTLDLHHMEWVKDGGEGDAADLLALCDRCHDLHTQEHIPESAIRHWKGILHSLNHAFSRESVDLLLFLKKEPTSGEIWFTGDSALKFAELIAAGLVRLSGGVFANAISVPGPETTSAHHVRLTAKGEALVDTWLQGDEDAYKAAMKVC